MRCLRIYRGKVMGMGGIIMEMGGIKTLKGGEVCIFTNYI